LRRAVQLIPRGLVVPESWRHEGTGLRGANGLARAGLWENDMPEIDVRRDEGNAHKAVFEFLPQGSDVAFRGLGSHLIENPDVLAGDQRRIHQQKRTVSADHIGGGLQVNRFAFG